MPATTSLRRVLGLASLTYYGLGTILGAGIYVLVGKVSGHAGLFAPLSFALAGVIAFFTAFSYAELSARYPSNAGAAVYVREGLGRPWLSVLVGSLVVLVAIVTCASLVRGFVGYLHVFVQMPDWLAMALIMLVLGLLAAWGIGEAVGAASAITLVEIGGLLLILAASGNSLSTLPARLPELIPPFNTDALRGIALGAFVAFYAFLGFEDMVNVAEEVRDPQRTLPRAILLALGTATLLYLLVALAGVLSLSPEELAKSDAPLADIYFRTTGHAPLLIGGISLFAVINGALIQIILGARVLYGMSRAGWLPSWLPAWLHMVSPRTQTPLAATALLSLAALALALWLPLLSLAKATSFFILIVFALVNLSLLRIKRRLPKVEGIRCYPRCIPLAGLLSTAGLIAFQLAAWLAP